MKKIKLLSLGILILTSINACFHEDESPDSFIFPLPIVNQKTASALHKSESCDDFKNYLGQNLIEQYLDNDGGSWGWCPNCIGMGRPEIFVDTGVGHANDTGTTAGAGGAASAVESNPGTVTGTNNQEIGVDELDVLKTDASGNIYIAQDKYLLIADAFPPEEINELSRLNFDKPVFGLFLDEENERLLVFSRHWEEIKETSEDYRAYYGYYSKPIVEVNVIDISDLSAPTIASTLKYNGNYESARFINQRLHIVLNHPLYNIEDSFSTRKFYEDLERYRTLKFLDLPSTKADEETFRASLAQMILKGINSLNLDEVFPYFQNNDQAKTTLMQCTDIYHPEVSLKSAGLLSVVSMDSDGNNRSVSSILSSGGIVYASLNSLYVVQNSYGWWQINDDQQTAIHKFALNDIGTSYSASGVVSGVVNNSFSLSEYQNNLRVATTETLWPEDSTQQIRHNHLFILGESESSSLDILGSYEEFAPDERIYSTRYLGDRGFIVTFRQVDPLFAFDLSDPTKPILKSELKIPGFSTYMHPIDENHLLTIGRAATNQGQVEETQLQIFDISDMSNVQKTFDHIPELLKNNNGYGNSIAEHDHHAFTYSAENNILAIPLSYHNWQDHDSFAGITTFKIDVETGITENGSVDHSNFVEATECEKNNNSITANGARVLISEDACIEHYYSWYVQPNRSVIMTDESGDNSYLYSISRLGINANDLLNMEMVVGSLAVETNDQ